MGWGSGSGVGFGSDGDSSSQIEYFDYDQLAVETNQAWLVEIDGEEMWLPKSQCELDRKAKTIGVPVWLAEKKGLM